MWRNCNKVISLFMLMTIMFSLSFNTAYAVDDEYIYAVHDASKQRRVVTLDGSIEADWSLCMDANKWSPGSDSGPTEGYKKTDNANASDFAENGGSDNVFQKAKRILYYRLKNPSVLYGVIQNEYYYQMTGDTGYNTNWGNTNLNAEKGKIRAFAEDDSSDETINKELIVAIYTSKNKKYQNVITARLKETPTEPTKVFFSKKALTEDGEELAGATIQLTTEGGKLLREWVTDGKVSEFSLEDGSYVFTETSAPDKYEVSTAITFVVKDGKVTVNDVEVTGNTIVMVDKLKETPTEPTKVFFSKKALTEDGEELAGATIQLTTEGGKLLKEWVTDGKVSEFSLEDGSYVFTETSAPDKYEVATAITFVVKDGKVTVNDVEVTGNTIVMVDKLKETPTEEVLDEYEDGTDGDGDGEVKGADTGDNTHMIGWIALLIVSALSAIVVFKGHHFFQSK